MLIINMMRINGLEGNDYLFGADGDDTFIETANSGNDRIHGGKGNDTVIYKDVKLTNLAIEDFGLKLSFDDGSTDTLYSIENISLNGETHSTKDLILEKIGGENQLLDFYKPIIHWSGNDDANLQVYGQITEDKDSYKLDYELRESDSSWFLQIHLGQDLLPTYFYTETGGWLGDHTTQIRGAFDTSIQHKNNSIETFTHLKKEAMYLTNDIKTTDVLDDYSIISEGIKQNDWDWDDYKNLNEGKSDHYGLGKLDGLKSGQMEMGFLFQDTGLQALGHFDLIGNEILA